MNEKITELPAPRSAVRALTMQFPNYMDRLLDLPSATPWDLWSIYLAVAGDMVFAGANLQDAASASWSVPEVTLDSGISRHTLWARAVEEIFNILGDPELYYRTGWDTAALRPAIDKFFALRP